MSKINKPKDSRYTESSKEKSLLQGGFPARGYKDEYDTDDEDDYGIPVTPGGSVLTPSPNPYNILDKIKQANEQLQAERNKLNLRPKTPKVRFVEPMTIVEDAIAIDPTNVAKSPRRPETESKPTKILLVTLPTAYSIESEEILTDDDNEDDLDFTNNNFSGNRSFQESSFTTFSDEELKDSTSIPSEEALTSSIETVICRNETKESELTECFTKSINLNTENISSDNLNSNKHIDYKEPLSKSNDAAENVIEIVESRKEEVVFSDNYRMDPKTAQSSKIQKSSSIKTVKSNLSESKTSCKLIVNVLTKKNTTLDSRPSTAPAKRACCKMGIMTKLPAYNGLRSEYGLSKEQLLEREKKKCELSKALKTEKEKQCLEDRQKQKENEMKFKHWLIKKKKEAEAKTLRRLCQSNYCFRTTPAPTSHLDKIGILRRKMLKQENTYLLLDEIFKNARPQEQKTYRIYLGLCV